MKKTRILISSVLKPINDTRMFEKIGASLAKLPEAEVHIAGFPAVIRSTGIPVFCHPFISFKRLSWGRLKTQWAYWQLLRQLKPAILIVSTHELLVVSILYTFFFGGKIWYDVRENYFLNLTTQNAYPPVIRYLLAYGIRCLEYLTAPGIAEYLLAERCYAAELPFIGKKYTILENKYQPLTEAVPVTFPRKLSPGQVRLLYSGTISEIHGIFEAIRLVDKLHRENAGFSLTIIGYCASTTTLQQVKAAITLKPYISLIGGDQLVSHDQIIKHIRQSDLGLLPYQPHPSTVACTPTKLFEYLAHVLPVLVQDNPLWAKYVHRYQAGICLNFSEPDTGALLQQLFTRHFYPDGLATGVFWETEEENLFSVAQKYI